MTQKQTTSHSITKTIIGLGLSIEGMVPSTLDTDTKYTTLNTKYQNNSLEKVLGKKQILYFGIGTRGYRNSDDENGAQVLIASPTDLDLYKPLPFRCVPEDQDLSAEERGKYRMRVSYIHPTSNERYWAYYLKKLDYISNKISLVRIDPDTKIETPYSFSESNLNPVPADPSSTGVGTGIVEEVKAYALAVANVTGKEVIESVNVIYNGDMTKARISEWGFYSGEDRTMSAQSHNNQPFEMIESIEAQLILNFKNLGNTFETELSDNNRRIAISGSNIVMLDSN